LEHSKSTHAMGRVGTTDEIAEAIVFLGKIIIKNEFCFAYFFIL
jgi:hypothetical protein